MDKKSAIKRIEELKTIISDNWRKTPTDIIPLCYELRSLADEYEDEAARGFAVFFLGYCYYSLNDLKNAEKFLMVSRGYLLDTQQWELLAKNYNALGIIADCSGDHAFAIDYFFQGLVYSKEHEFHRVTFSLSCNLATVYIKLEEYAYALDCLGLCEMLMNEKYESSDHERYAAYINVATCYMYMDMYDGADKYLDLAEAADNRTPVTGQKETIHFMRAKLANKRGDDELCKKFIDESCTMSLEGVVLYDLFDEFYSYAQLLINVGEYELFLNLTSQLEDKIDDPNSQLKLVELKMQYYSKVNDTEGYAKGAIEYYELSTVVQHNRFISDKHNASVRISLQEEHNRREKVEKANAILKEQSEFDALTHVKNRYSLNEISDTAFTKAYDSHSFFAVEMLDIDHYKQYNDNYGHQAGDDCLVTIAAELRKMEKYEGVHVGRYGGDEFMIIYEGYDKEAVTRMAQEIHDNIEALDLKHEFSEVAPRITLSQGIFVKVPSGNNKLWDFTSSADLALYEAKRTGKNHAVVASSRAEVNEFTTHLSAKKEPAHKQ